MSYKDEFHKLTEQQRFEDARALLEAHMAFANDDGFIYANMGWILNHIGRCQEAIAYLKKGLSAFPQDAWMMAQLGYAYNHTDQFQNALECLQNSLSMGHDEPWIHGEIGWAYRWLNEPQKAIEYFENALLDDPDNEWILSQAAYTYCDLQDKKSAEDYFKRIVLLSPNDDSYYDLAMFYKMEKRYKEELELLKNVKEDDSGWRSFEMAVAYNRIGNHEEAIYLLQSCLEKGRDDTGIREELAGAYLSVGDEKQAEEQYQIEIRYYERALEKHPENTPQILQDMAWIAERLQDWEKELLLLKQLSQMEPNDTWVMYHLAKVYWNMDEYEKALPYLDACEKEKGKEIEPLSLKTLILGRLNRYDDALSALNDLQKMGRNDCWLWNEMGWDYSEVEQYQDAIHCYRKSLQLDGKDPWVNSQLAWNLARMRQYQSALKYFERAVSYGRNDGWIFANIGWIYHHLDKDQQALPYFEKAKELGYEEPWFLNLYQQMQDALHLSENTLTTNE